MEGYFQLCKEIDMQIMKIDDHMAKCEDIDSDFCMYLNRTREMLVNKKIGLIHEEDEQSPIICLRNKNSIQITERNKFYCTQQIPMILRTTDRLPKIIKPQLIVNDLFYYKNFFSRSSNNSATRYKHISDQSDVRICVYEPPNIGRLVVYEGLIFDTVRSNKNPFTLAAY